MNRLTLGSLFDGSGGFPLAGALNKINAIWASEVEPYPIAVTKERFPQMKHLGDVMKINGTEIEPVDIITFGSPCQDMSIAGNRAGMKHEGKGDDTTTRSGLFYEAIRIIREMREKTHGRHPTFAVWENVPGAFSSNKGEDFRCVLEEFCKITDEGVSIPRPDKGKWKSAGEIVGCGYSVAWRQLDAQYWGVPQRRKRIYLVADFAGRRAGEILFERESVQGHSTPGRETKQAITTNDAGSTGGGSGVGCLNHIFDPQGSGTDLEQNVVCYDARGNGDGVQCPTLTGDHESRITDYTGVVVYRNPKIGEYAADGTVPTMAARDFKSKPPRKYIIRRLTPRECCRLQGFPDWWENGVDGRDSARYKMWGNGIALPCAAFVLEGIATKGGEEE